MPKQRVIQDPWSKQQPYLEYGFGQAQNLYNNPYFYQQAPFSGVAPFSGAQNQGLQQIMNIAGRTGPDLNSYARREAGRTLQGRYLNQDSNPYLAAMYNTAKQDFLNPVNLGAEATGRTGSGLHAQAAANALTQATDASYGQHYEQERQRMMQTLGMAPELADTRYADPRMLLSAGGMIQNQGQRQIDDEMRRFDYAQNRPWDLFNRYMGGVGGQQWGGTQTSRTPSPDMFSQIAGGALGGAQLLNLLPGGLGGIFKGIGGLFGG